MKIKIPEYISGKVNKYKYILPVCVIGLILIMLPSGGKDSAEEDTSIEENLFLFDVKETEKAASEFFSKIDGVGKTEVFLTVKAGYEKEYVSDTKERSGTSGESFESDTEISMVKLNEASRETPLLKKIKYPEYLGAVIVCEGGDDSKIRYQLTQAMKSLTGISSENISVFKMKK